MKIYKIIGLALLSIVILVFVVAATAPDNITITSNITINATPQKVFNNVVVLKNWKYWSPFEHDSTMADLFTGPDTGVGASRSWNGKVIGKGKISVIEAQPYTHIKNILDFGHKGNTTGNWTFSPEETTKTTVMWSTHIGNLSFPFERLLGKILKPMMKPMFDKGLKDLKKYTETGVSPVLQIDTLVNNNSHE